MGLNMLLHSIKQKDNKRQERELVIHHWGGGDNPIDKWFADNCQDNPIYEVSRETLEELRDICIGIVNGEIDKEEGLPMYNGFYSNRTDHEEWYMEILKDTADTITELLADEEIEYFEYCSC